MWYIVCVFIYKFKYVLCYVRLCVPFKRVNRDVVLSGARSWSLGSALLSIAFLGAKAPLGLVIVKVKVKVTVSKKFQKSS